MDGPHSGPCGGPFLPYTQAPASTWALLPGPPSGGVPSTCPPFLVSDPVKAAYGERRIDHGRVSPLHAAQLGLKKGALLESAEKPSPLWVCVVRRLSVKPPSPARWPSCSELEALARQPRGQLTLQLSLWLSTNHLPHQTLRVSAKILPGVAPAVFPSIVWHLPCSVDVPEITLALLCCQPSPLEEGVCSAAGRVPLCPCAKQKQEIPLEPS